MGDALPQLFYGERVYVPQQPCDDVAAVAACVN